MGMYNGSDGTLGDLSECLLNAFGIETSAVKAAKEGFIEALAQAGPDGTVYTLPTAKERL